LGGEGWPRSRERLNDMKLDSKQMHIVSQLFMAASKAGHTFDLARLTKDPIFASETLARLLLEADQARNDHLQSLVLVTMEALSPVTTPASLLAPVSEPSQPEVTKPAALVDRYIGQLR
jgi:L-fucose mutarotase/ribose pyranase (RbsD/FucU family)